jgi:hypothetical protein
VTQRELKTQKVEDAGSKVLSVLVLSLGGKYERTAHIPAGVSDREGAYRVRPADHDQLGSHP